MNRKAVAHVFWGAKILIDQGQVNAARKLVQCLPPDVYEYAIDQSIDGRWTPMKRLFILVLAEISPVHAPNHEKDMEKHRKVLELFSADTICD